MTTVAWRAGCIAADRLLDGWMQDCKLFRLKDGSILSGAGQYDDILEVAAWIKGGCKKADKPDFSQRSDDETSDLILACPDGKAYWLTMPWLRRVEIKDEFYAIGSGAKVALGAMAAGATARQAVEIAARFDDATGSGVDALEVRLIP